MPWSTSPWRNGSKGRLIREARFELKENDYMVLISDGYDHAGVGGLYRLGWGWKNIALAVRRCVETGVIDTHQTDPGPVPDMPEAVR